MTACHIKKQPFSWEFCPRNILKLDGTHITKQNFARPCHWEDAMVRELQLIAIGLVFVFLGAIVVGVI